MNIGEAARRTGVTAKMIRYYEEIGLLGTTARSDAGYRTYREQDLHALRFVREARHVGFAIDDIRRLLALWHDRTRSSAEVKTIALEHLSDLDQRITALSAMRDTLGHLVACCHGDDRPDCPILDQLSGAGDAAAPSANGKIKECAHRA